MNVLNLFTYAVITEDGDVLAVDLPWDEVQALCELIGEEVIDVFSCHEDPIDSYVTVPVIDDLLADIARMSVRVRQMLKESPPKGHVFCEDGSSVEVQLPEHLW